MFSGIICAQGEVIATSSGQGAGDEQVRTGDRQVRIACVSAPRAGARPLDVGSMLAVDGLSLKVAALGEQDGRMWFDVAICAQTARDSTAGGWQPGRRVNLEPALRLGDEIGGHIVLGYVDAAVQVQAVEPDGDSLRFWFDAPQDLARLIAAKGAVALDGTSLSVAAVDGRRFAVNLTAHSLRLTHWAGVAKGDAVNLEIDTTARYLARMQQAI